MYFTSETERKDPVVVHPAISLAIDLSLFPRCAISGIKETPEMNHIGCAATAQTGVLELRNFLGSWILGGRQKLPQAGPHQIQFLAIRIQAFHLMGSVSSLEHKYSSPESSLYMTVIYDALKITTGERVC